MTLSDFTFWVGELDQQLECSHPGCHWSRDLWWAVGDPRERQGTPFTLADAVRAAEEHDRSVHA